MSPRAPIKCEHSQKVYTCRRCGYGADDYLHMVKHLRASHGLDIQISMSEAHDCTGPSWTSS